MGFPEGLSHGGHMKRLTYIYWLLPLLVLLSCGDSLIALIGAGGALAVAIPLILVVWGLVWMRLYSTGLLRPETAVLAILPQSIYYMARYTGTDFFTAPAAQNLYALSWLTFVAVIIMSMKPAAADGKPKRLAQDATFILMCLVTIAYSFATMATYALTLFYRS